MNEILQIYLEGFEVSFCLIFLWLLIVVKKDITVKDIFMMMVSSLISWLAVILMLYVITSEIAEQCNLPKIGDIIDALCNTKIIKHKKDGRKQK